MLTLNKYYLVIVLTKQRRIIHMLQNILLQKLKALLMQFLTQKSVMIRHSKRG